MDKDRARTLTDPVSACRAALQSPHTVATPWVQALTEDRASQARLLGARLALQLDITLGLAAVLSLAGAGLILSVVLPASVTLPWLAAASTLVALTLLAAGYAYARWVRSAS